MCFGVEGSGFSNEGPKVLGNKLFGALGLERQGATMMATKDSQATKQETDNSSFTTIPRVSSSRIKRLY